MKLRKGIGIALFVLALAGCGRSAPPAPTPLEIQSIQTREFAATKEVVFRSIISVFQDLGYMVNTADLETGIITAESSTKNHAWLFLLTDTSKKQQVKATAFVESTGGASSLARLNFVEINQASSFYGSHDRYDVPLLDVRLYQNAFEKIEQAIFIRSRN